MAGNPAPTQADYNFAWSADPDYPAVGHIDDFGPLYAPWRKPITDAPWPFTVENCGYAGYRQGHWTPDGTQLYCIGCGLDMT